MADYILSTNSGADQIPSPAVNPTVATIVQTAVSAPSKEEVVETERDMELDRLSKVCLVDMATDMPDEEVMLAITDTLTGVDVPLCAKEDLVTIKAAPKNGKSTLMTIFVAAILCGQWHHVKCLTKGSRILYIDTEMKPRDTQRMGRMALTLAGMPANVNHEGFQYANLRKYGPEEIIEMVEYLIRTCHPDVVFIDGSLDLCNNFNDPDESQKLVKGQYLRWIDTYHISIITAIHTNKTNDTHASQGHLGSALDKKGEVTLECARDKDGSFFNVSAPTCRHKDVPKFFFKYGDNGLPVICDEEVKELQAAKALSDQQKKEEKDRQKLEILKQKTLVAMKDTGTSGMSRSELVKRLCVMLELGDSSVQARIKTLTDIGFLTATGYNGNLVVNTNNSCASE